VKPRRCWQRQEDMETSGFVNYGERPRGRRLPAQGPSDRGPRAAGPGRPVSCLPLAVSWSPQEPLPTT
jgi:hypothetical protein